MATFVLVHGGGHGGWCYQRVARLLRAEGHEVYTPTMTGLGEREHLLTAAVDLNFQITDIVKVIQFEDLREVILVGHSYGGMVITGVADQVADRIANLVYLDAAYPLNGESLVDHAGAIMLAARETAQVVNGVELVLFPGNDPMGFYGVTDPEQIAWMKPKLTPHPWACFEQKLVLRNEATMRRIPRSFISCSYRMDDESQDLKGSRVLQKAAADGRYWEIDTGHDLMISEPEATANALLELARMMPGQQPQVQQTSRVAQPPAVPAVQGGVTTVEGRWAMKMKGPAGPVAGTLIFEKCSDGSFTGTQGFAGGANEPLSDVKVEGCNISWVHHIAKPLKMKLAFSGVMEGHQLSGKVKAGFVGTYTFTGVKQ